MAQSSASIALGDASSLPTSNVLPYCGRKVPDRFKSEMLIIYLINPTSVVKPAALQLATNLRLLKIGIAVVAET
jgi:hypothetical protein